MVATLESFNWMLFLETANPKNFSNCINSHWRDGITSPATSSCENKFQSAKCLNIHIRTLRTQKWSTALYGPIDHDLNSNWGRGRKRSSFLSLRPLNEEDRFTCCWEENLFFQLWTFSRVWNSIIKWKALFHLIEALAWKNCAKFLPTFSINIHCLLYITWRGSSNSRLQKSRYGKALDKHFSSQVWWLMFYV